MTLEDLISWARTYKMSDEEREAQVVSFAYGNVHLSNPQVKRDDVEKAVKERRGG